MVLHDVRYSIRFLARHRVYSLVAVITLGLCITANAFIFPVVNGIVLRPLPYPDSERILTVYNSYPAAHQDRAGNSIPDYFDRLENIGAFEEVGMYSLAGSVVGEGETIRQVYRINVTASVLRILGARPRVGRLLEEDDAVPGDHLKVVISNAFWKSHFGGDSTAIGRDLAIDGQPHTVIGVLAEGFEFPTWDAAIWTPLAYRAEDRAAENRYSGGPEMLAKLRPGATLQTARQQIDALNERTLAAYPPDIQTLVRDAGFRTEVLPFRADLIQAVRDPLLLLWCAVLCVMLIGCMNVANLVLISASSRTRDFAVRLALGASRRRIVGRIVTETLALAIAGGTLGLLVGSWCMPLVGSFAAYDVPRLGEVHLDLSAAAYTTALATVVGMAAGALPALLLMSGDLPATLANGPRFQRGGTGAVRVQRALVIMQIAVTTILTIGGGLMLATMRNLLAVHPGFDPVAVLGTAVTLPENRYPDVASRARFIDAALEEVRAQPGIENAAMVSHMPFSGASSRGVVTPEGMGRRTFESVFTSEIYVASPEYFDVMGIPVVEGRSFASSDYDSRVPVAIIDEWLARRYWPEGHPLGSRVSLTAHTEDNPRWYRIVGVVGAVRDADLSAAEGTGALYLPHQERCPAFFRFAVKTIGAPLDAVPEVRQAIKRVDGSISPFWTVSLEQRVAASLIPRRLLMWLLLAASGVGLLLATLGVYGVLTYSVRVNMREVGIRMALGGTGRQIVRLVAGQWLRLLGAGLGFGMAGALAFTRLVVSQLYGVTPTDPVVFVVAMAVIAIVGSIAYLLPASRAAHVDPLLVLRSE